MDSAADVWACVKELLGKRLTSTAISTWFMDCDAVELKDGLLVLSTLSSFKRDIIATRFGNELKDALSELFSSNFDVLVLGPDDLEEYRRAAPTNGCVSPFSNTQFTFERFVVGASNRFAHACATAVAASPAQSYNPLFIYGESGLGKTHLLYAIGHVIKKTRPEFKIVYIKGDDFTNELIGAIQTGKNAEFREKYRLADILLVDDIQFIAGKLQTQEEFFHTFNTLYEANKQIVMTSDRPPMEILRLEDRLKSRFEWGILADVQPPDYETRVAIAKNKAQQLGISLPDEIAAFIAENITRNIRQIEGAVQKVAAYHDLVNAGVTGDSAVQAVKDMIKAKTRETVPTPALIIQEAAAYYSIKPEDVRGQRKNKNTAAARQIAMYLIRSLTDLSLKDIGAEFGDKDHSTVLYAIRKVEDSISDNSALADTVKDITANIRNKNVG